MFFHSREVGRQNFDFELLGSLNFYFTFLRTCSSRTKESLDNVGREKEEAGAL